MAEYVRSLIPLLTITRGETTVRCAAWPESIRNQGEQYEPFPFMFVLDEWDQRTTWKRVEIHFDHSAIAAAFPTPFPGEGPINASIQMVSERDPEGIVPRMDGVLTFDDNKVYFKPVPKLSTR
jgi:hypothetical protein